MPSRIFVGKKEMKKNTIFSRKSSIIDTHNKLSVYFGGNYFGNIETFCPPKLSYYSLFCLYVYDPNECPVEKILEKGDKK